LRIIFNLRFVVDVAEANSSDVKQVKYLKGLDSVSKKTFTIVPGLSLLIRGAMLGIALLVAAIQLSGDVLADQQPPDKKTAAAHHE